MKKERIINMIDSNARLEKQQLGKLPSLLSYERKSLLSAAVYIRHTSESLSSAFFAPLRSNFTLSSRILSSLYPYPSSSYLFAHRCRLQAPENPTHTLSALTLARDRIVGVMPTEKTKEISFWNLNDGYRDCNFLLITCIWYNTLS